MSCAARFRFFRKSLLPTAVLAGFIALLVRMSGALPIDAGLMEMVTYHSIAIGFIALSLQIPDKKKKAESAGLIAARSGALIVSTYLLQGLLGFWLFPSGWHNHYAELV